jgi:hypothetical protein
MSLVEILNNVKENGVLNNGLVYSILLTTVIPAQAGIQNFRIVILSKAKNLWEEWWSGFSGQAFRLNQAEARE